MVNIREKRESDTAHNDVLSSFQSISYKISTLYII